MTLGIEKAQNEILLLSGAHKLEERTKSFVCLTHPLLPHRPCPHVTGQTALEGHWCPSKCPFLPPNMLSLASLNEASAPLAATHDPISVLGLLVP